MDKTNELTVFEEYLNRRVAPGTVRVYIYALKLFFRWLDDGNPSQRLAQLYVDQITASGLSPNTVSTRAHAIRRWFRFKGNKIDLDCPTIRQGEPEYLTVDQVYKVIGACNTLLERALVIVLFDTAVRISELLNINVDDIDWNGGFITVTRKGGRVEQVNTGKDALGVLEEWLAVRESSDNRVFMDIDYLRAWATIKGIGKRTGMPLHPHIFRHSRAIQMLMTGAEITTVQQHLGHTRLATTADLYGKFKAVHLKKRVPAW